MILFQMVREIITVSIAESGSTYNIDPVNAEVVVLVTDTDTATTP